MPNWVTRSPYCEVPLTLLPKAYPTKIMTVGIHKNKPYDWIIRNDVQYCHWAMSKELKDELNDSLSIFAHYCLENPELADQHTNLKQITKTTGPCQMVTTTFTGCGRAMHTGRATVSMFSITAQDVVASPKRFRGHTIDPQRLKLAITMVSEGRMSLDDLSWIWAPGNYLVTEKEEIFYFMHS